MLQDPKIVTLSKKKLIGQAMFMSIQHNKTGLLWSNFAPRIQEIRHRVSNDKFSLQVYPGSYFLQFDPTQEFEKWALVEVDKQELIPDGLRSFDLTGGLYAVFEYKGSSNDPSIFQYIYSHWLPNSVYDLDDRPHFEVLGEKYKNLSPDSEEEIWIPIKEK